MKPPVIKSFLLRIPDHILQEIKVWAEYENRSANAQVIHILRRALVEWRNKPTA